MYLRVSRDCGVSDVGIRFVGDDLRLRHFFILSYMFRSQSDDQHLFDLQGK